MIYYCLDKRVYFRSLIQVCVSIHGQNAQFLGKFNHYVTLNLAFFRPPLASFVRVYNNHFRRQFTDEVRHYISFSKDLLIVAVLNQCSGWTTIPETNYKFRRKQDNSQTHSCHTSNIRANNQNESTSLANLLSDKEIIFQLFC